MAEIRENIICIKKYTGGGGGYNSLYYKELGICRFL
jgi:hypothetical protein